MESIINVKINKLKDHPFNDILYDKINDPREKLMKSLITNKKKYGYSNKEIVYITKNLYILSGHRRKWASEESDGKLDELRCVIVNDHEFNPKSLTDPKLKQIEIDKLDEYNEPDITRNQTSWPVILRKYSVNNLNKFALSGKYFTPKERNNWAAEKCSYTTDSFKKMTQIYELGRHDLIQDVEKGDRSVSKAWTIANALQPKVKLKYDPKRMNWVEFFINNPKAMKRVVKYANDMLRQSFDINVNEKKIPLDIDHGHEQNMISTNLSNFYMSAISLVLEEEGFKSCTPREEAGLPDVRIKCLSKPGFEWERIEVKVAKFNGHGSSTKISAGPGATSIVPHSFLIVVYDPDTNRQFVALSDLTKNDWTRKGTKCSMGMNIWADNHLDNCVIFHGAGFIDSKKVFQMNMDEVKND